MSHDAVFVVEAIVWTGVVSSLKEAVHFVLIEINHAHEAVVVIIVDKIRAGFAVGDFFLLHKITPSLVYQWRSCTKITNYYLS